MNNTHTDKIFSIASEIIEGEYDFTDLFKYFTLNADMNFLQSYNDVYIRRCICNYVVYARLTYTKKESYRIQNICIPDDDYEYADFN